MGYMYLYIYIWDIYIYTHITEYIRFEVVGIKVKVRYFFRTVSRIHTDNSCYTSVQVLWLQSTALLDGQQLDVF